ncbi:MAG: alpha/beta hydrolase [bacterium]|nr:alpha/beta hydrolase [bacterium]
MGEKNVSLNETMEQISVEPSLWHKEPAPPGDALPVLFVHGLWGYHWYWSKFVDAFYAEGYDCYSIDLYGHSSTSRQSPVPGNIPLGKYVDEVKASVEMISKRNKPPLLVGHSMGGLVIQKASESLGDMAAGIVLLTSAAPKGILMLPVCRAILFLIKLLIKSFFSQHVMPREREFAYMALNNTKGEEKKLALSRYVPDYSLVLREIIFNKIPVDKDKVACPVLVVSGSLDRMIRPEDDKKLAEYYNAQLKEYNAAHWAMREEGVWKEICEGIWEWCKNAGVS